MSFYSYSISLAHTMCELVYSPLIRNIPLSFLSLFGFYSTLGIVFMSIFGCLCSLFILVYYMDIKIYRYLYTVYIYFTSGVHHQTYIYFTASTVIILYMVNETHLETEFIYIYFFFFLILFLFFFTPCIFHTLFIYFLFFIFLSCLHPGLLCHEFFYIRVISCYYLYP